MAVGFRLELQGAAMTKGTTRMKDKVLAERLDQKQTILQTFWHVQNKVLDLEVDVCVEG